MFDIKKAKFLCDKATPGEWWTGGDQDAVWGPDGDQIAKVYGNLALGGDEEDNAEFIAAARTLLPAAIAEIERLQVLLADVVIKK